MVKKYVSKSIVSLSLNLSDGSKKHISFEGKTGGGSVFYTSDETIQAALANHKKAGRLFAEEAIEKVVEVPAVEAPVGVGKGKVRVTSLDDAKNYLSDAFGISRTKLRSKKQIDEAASAHGISFVGFE